VKGHAVFDVSRCYRYLLTRTFDVGAGRVLFVMLNPSTADEHKSDPTVRRCEGFAQAWGFAALDIANLFGLRATDPGELRRVPDPVGAENDEHLLLASARASVVVAAWGAGGRLHDRDVAVMRQLRRHACIRCLGFTKSGDPRHPLYVRAAARPEQYLGRGTAL